MNRDAAVPIAIAVVCALAVVVAAATLTDTRTTSGEGVGSGGGSGVGASNESASIDLMGENESGLVDLGEEGQLLTGTTCVRELNSPLVSWGILVGMVAIGGFVWRRDGKLPAMAVVVALLVPLVAVKVLLTGCPTPEDTQEGVPEPLSNQSGAGGGAGDPGGGGAVVPVDVPIFVYVLVGVGLLLLAAVAITSREDVVTKRIPEVFAEPSADLDDEDEADTGALGRAAGRAADRIETGTDADNEVYRAWVEMTRHLDVDHPHSSTPAEFAAAAVDAGLDPDDVDELTAQFEAVRYGGESPTGDRERRAVEALRRIEAEYAEEGGGST